MNKAEIRAFTAWTKTVSISMIKLDSVPEQYKELVTMYREHRASDPNDVRCYQCHHNAMVVVYNHIKRNQPKLNNCGKCGGTGFIQAYRHINQGICFACNAEKSAK